VRKLKNTNISLVEIMRRRGVYYYAAGKCCVENALKIMKSAHKINSSQRHCQGTIYLVSENFKSYQL
jgi:hypothetical protein